MNVNARSGRPHVCAIVSPDVFAAIIDEGTPAQREVALRNLATTAAVQARRAVLAPEMRRLALGPTDLSFLAPGTGHHNSVYDVGHGGHASLPGTLVRRDGGEPAADPAANEAFENAEVTYQFYLDVLGRNSIDGAGLELVSSIHFDRNYDNAFWNGSQMVYGDGGDPDGIILEGSLTGCLDVIGHELTHGVTQFTAGLEYKAQSGALNESFSDVFGSLVKQHHRGQKAEEADWLIGEGVLEAGLGGTALRSMKSPGTAFRFDRQPAHMDQYADLPVDDDPRNDRGGVHINSGIPNHAFYRAAVALGGNAWETVGPIWYDALTTRLGPNDQFEDAAAAVIASAEQLRGADSREASAVRDAWSDVGIVPATVKA